MGKFVGGLKVVVRWLGVKRGKLDTDQSGRSAPPLSVERSVPAALSVWEGSRMQGEVIWIYIRLKA